MTDQGLSTAFNNCIDRLAAGQTIDACLRAYPEYAAQLAPMLEAGRTAVRAQVAADEVARAQARVNFRFEQALRTTPPSHGYPWQRLASMAALLVIVIGLLLGGTVATAQDSLPGDLLYGVKLWSESVRLSLAGNDQILRDEFAQRRITETETLLALRRESKVVFAGEIVAVQEDTITVAGLTVQIPAPSSAAEQFHVGDQVEVRAQTTARGELLAVSILVAEPAPVPDVPPTETPTPTATPSLTVTLSPTVIASPTATWTQTPSRTARPSATPTAVLLPTLTASPRPTGTAAFLPTLEPSSTSESSPAVESHRTVTITPGSSGGQDSCDPTPPEGWVAYPVQAGETLSELALRSGSSLQGVIDANCIDDPGLIVANQVLFFPRSPAVDTPATETGSDAIGDGEGNQEQEQHRERGEDATGSSDSSGGSGSTDTGSDNDKDDNKSSGSSGDSSGKGGK